MEHTLRTVPFDAHVHFRDPGSALFNAVVPLTARQCWGAVVMPNTNPFITTPESAAWYATIIRERAGETFTPIMTGYLTADMDPGTIVRGFQRRAWRAMKFYPKGATTNSHGGMQSPMDAARSLEVMERIGMPFLIHPEVNMWRGAEADPYDRESIFVAEVLPEIRRTFPNLKISLEHITTRTVVAYMSEYGARGSMVCTITAHHLLANRIDYFHGGPNPHLHCYPVLKRKEDQEALLAFIAKGHAFVSAGSDSAPHPTTAKERACGCAGGVFTAHAMAELYAEAFEQAGALEHLDAFLGENGPRFYDLEPHPAEGVSLHKERWFREEMIETEGGVALRPFGYHEVARDRRPMQWRLHAEH